MRIIYSRKTSLIIPKRELLAILFWPVLIADNRQMKYMREYLLDIKVIRASLDADRRQGG